jgi:geranylgeranyl diphosphate synthase type II
MLDGLTRHIERIEQHLIICLPATTPEPLKSAMHYAVTAGGKRLRPVLTLVTCEMLGGNSGQALNTAAAIEMVHTYSLIHDDLPAMDDDALRRGKPTVHIAFDEATAILAGDALQSLAFQLIAEDTSLNAETRVDLLALLANAIGPTGMVAGQVLDMASENTRIDADALAKIHQHKTGDLIATAISAGACIAGANSDDRAALTRFGYLLGLAFQIRDDLLDVIGTTEQLGKPQGSDVAQNKSTYTSIYGVEGAERHLRKVRDEALEALKPLNNRAGQLIDLTHFVAERLS